LVGFYLGSYVSDLTGGRPIFIALGVLLGLGAGILGIIYIIKQFVEDT
jgi:hypothetical protein